MPFRTQLVADLRKLGLKAGDTALLHVSVKAIGSIIGGARVVLDSIFEVLTPEGTLMMLACWEGNPYEMGDIWKWDVPGNRESPPFDPLTSPADHRNLSILAEYLRTWQGAHRSTHPLSSFVAVGRRAQWLTENHPAYYGMGADSPLARLCEAGGRVLVLGVPLSNLTLLHHAEHLVEIPDKRIDRYRMPVIENGEKVWIKVEDFDTTDGIADFGVEDYFLEIGQSYLASGHGSSGKVGNADSYLFDATSLTEYGVEWMKHNHRPAQG